jgi:hypothetical protein
MQAIGLHYFFFGRLANHANGKPHFFGTAAGFVARQTVERAGRKRQHQSVQQSVRGDALLQRAGCRNGGARLCRC